MNEHKTKGTKSRDCWIQSPQLAHGESHGSPHLQGKVLKTISSDSNPAGTGVDFSHPAAEFTHWLPIPRANIASCTQHPRADPVTDLPPSPCFSKKGVGWKLLAGGDFGSPPVHPQGQVHCGQRTNVKGREMGLLTAYEVPAS